MVQRNRRNRAVLPRRPPGSGAKGDDMSEDNDDRSIEASELGGTGDVGDTADETMKLTVSTRDSGELSERFCRWLVGVLPEGANPEVLEMSSPASNGMSSETLMVDASWTVDGQPGTQRLVVRMEPSGTDMPIFPEYRLGEQFETMQTVARLTDVPLPELYWYEESPEPLGGPFFVMGRVDGLVPPDVMPYTFGECWLFDATDDERERLMRTTVGVLAKLHAIEDAKSEFPALVIGDVADGGSALRAHVNAQREYYEWVVADGQRSPLIERAFAWLDDHWPEHEGPTVLSWGDSRIGNVMYRDFEPVATLDWEMAGLAPAEVDVAWLIFLHHFFQDITEVMGMVGMPDFLRQDDVVAAYEQAAGVTLGDMDFYMVYAAIRHATVMSRVGRRSIFFGEATAPDDIDDLIMHRQRLESMIAENVT